MTRRISVLPVPQNSRYVAILPAPVEGSVPILSPGTDDKTWERLYQFCFQKPYEPKKFMQLIGVSTQISNRIWEVLWCSIPTQEFHFQPKHLLWTLYHLKNYGAADFNEFGVCYKTFRLWTWKIIEALHASVNDVSKQSTQNNKPANSRSILTPLTPTSCFFFPSQVTLSDRFHPPLGPQESLRSPLVSQKARMVLCSMETLTRKPTDPKTQTEMYSPTAGGFSLKYHCCLRDGDGKICWGYGPVPGSLQELEILQQGGLHNLLEPGECVVAGAEFPVYPGVVTTRNFESLLPSKGGEHSEAESEAIRRDLKSLRQAGRRTMEVLKSFKCLTESWRYELNQHGVVFMVCLQLTNLIVTTHKYDNQNNDGGDGLDSGQGATGEK